MDKTKWEGGIKGGRSDQLELGESGGGKMQTTLIEQQ